jgi:hypothetical protein
LDVFNFDTLGSSNHFFTFPLDQIPLNTFVLNVIVPIPYWTPFTHFPLKNAPFGQWNSPYPNFTSS